MSYRYRAIDYEGYRCVNLTSFLCRQTAIVIESVFVCAYAYIEYMRHFQFHTNVRSANDVFNRNIRTIRCA
jgi:hypothetical protein